MAWLIENWAFLVAMLLAGVSLAAQVFDRHKGIRKRLQQEYEQDLNNALDMKARSMVELQERVTKLEGQLTAITRLYGENLSALQRANEENIDLKRQLQDHEELKRKLKQYEEQVRENHEEIRRLRERIETLERRDGTTSST